METVLAPPPDWLQDRLRAMGGDLAPRYESSLCGPITSLLVWFFPITRRFMVKPQARIRPEHAGIPLSDQSEELTPGSLDSYDAEVLLRRARSTIPNP